MLISDSLKNLYKAVTESNEAPSDDQIASLVQSLADNWPKGQSYTLPAASVDALGGVRKAESVSFAASTATAETCAVAVEAIIDALKASGAMG